MPSSYKSGLAELARLSQSIQFSPGKAARLFGISSGCHSHRHALLKTNTSKGSPPPRDPFPGNLGCLKTNTMYQNIMPGKFELERSGVGSEAMLALNLIPSSRRRHCRCRPYHIFYSRFEGSCNGPNGCTPSSCVKQEFTLITNN